ncbi:NmrA family protein, partial [Flavobacterium rivuli WB 3.3-2 = DSM 21788]
MSAQKPRILITGATGQVGQKTISFLQNNDSIEIVAAVRSAAKAQAFQDKGIATVILDFDNEATYTDALKDIDR